MNEVVMHKRFGRGVITERDEGHIKVEFDKQEVPKMFTYPDAFGSFLKFEDAGLQETVMKEYLLVKEKESIEIGQKHLEYNRQGSERKKEHLKVLRKRRKSVKVKEEKDKADRRKTEEMNDLVLRLMS